MSHCRRTPSCFTGAPFVDVCACPCRPCRRARAALLRRQDPQPGPLLVQDLTEQARYRRTMTAAPRPTALDMLARLTQGGLVQVPAAPPTAVVYTSRMRRVFDRWIFGDAPVRVAEVEPLYRARCDSRRPASW